MVPPPFPVLSNHSYPDSLLKTTEEALAPSRVGLMAAALTGTGRGGRICHPEAVGCPTRPLVSALQLSAPPSPPPARGGPIACRTSPALPPPTASRVRVPGPAEGGGGLSRSGGG